MPTCKADCGFVGNEANLGFCSSCFTLLKDLKAECASDGGVCAVKYVNNLKKEEQNTIQSCMEHAQKQINKLARHRLGTVKFLSNSFTPRELQDYLEISEIFLLSTEAKEFIDHIKKYNIHQGHKRFYIFEHVVYARVLDRHNLKDGAIGAYYTLDVGCVPEDGYKPCERDEFMW